MGMAVAMSRCILDSQCDDAYQSYGAQGNGGSQTSHPAAFGISAAAVINAEFFCRQAVGCKACKHGHEHNQRNKFLREFHCALLVR